MKVAAERTGENAVLVVSVVSFVMTVTRRAWLLANMVSPTTNSVVKLVPDPVTVVPALENGFLSKDGLTYAFPLRLGAKFHDGSELSAADVDPVAQIQQDGEDDPQGRHAQDAQAQPILHAARRGLANHTGTGKFNL